MLQSGENSYKIFYTYRPFPPVQCLAINVVECLHTEMNGQKVTFSIFLLNASSGSHENTHCTFIIQFYLSYLVCFLPIHLCTTWWLVNDIHCYWHSGQKALASLLIVGVIEHVHL